MRGRDIINAIFKALAATNAFDGVFLWGFPDASDESAEYSRAVAIVPAEDTPSDLYDDASSGEMFIDGRCRLVLLVREGDRQARDEAADRLLNACRNAINGAALNAVLGEPVVYPQWTKVGRAAWKTPEPPTREVEVVFQFRYDAPTWTGFDTSE